jgi:hypothetical protein
VGGYFCRKQVEIIDGTVQYGLGSTALHGTCQWSYEWRGRSYQAAYLGWSSAWPGAGLLVLGPEPVVLVPLALVAQHLVGLRHLLKLLLRLRVPLRQEWRRNVKQVQN